LRLTRKTRVRPQYGRGISSFGATRYVVAVGAKIPKFSKLGDHGRLIDASPLRAVTVLKVHWVTLRESSSLRDEARLKCEETDGNESSRREFKNCGCALLSATIGTIAGAEGGGGDAALPAIARAGVPRPTVQNPADPASAVHRRGGGVGQLHLAFVAVGDAVGEPACRVRLDGELERDDHPAGRVATCGLLPSRSGRTADLRLHDSGCGVAKRCRALQHVRLHRHHRCVGRVHRGLRVTAGLFTFHNPKLGSDREDPAERDIGTPSIARGFSSCDHASLSPCGGASDVRGRLARDGDDVACGAAAVGAR